jgi:hypothetical protein
VNSAGDARIASAVSAAQSGVERDFTRARMAKIINRAEKGNIKTYCSRFDGGMYPDGAIDDDRSTWLQPGEEMTVSMDAALHFCGNVWEPKAADGPDMIDKYGGWLYETPPEKGLTGGPPPMNRIGPPPFMPDLLVVQVDQRGREMHERISIWDRYVGNTLYNRPQRPHEAERQQEYLREQIAELQTV